MRPQRKSTYLNPVWRQAMCGCGAWVRVQTYRDCHWWSGLCTQITGTHHIYEWVASHHMTAHAKEPYIHANEMGRAGRRRLRSRLQYTATRRNTLENTATRCNNGRRGITGRRSLATTYRNETQCNALQHTATQCNNGRTGMRHSLATPYIYGKHCNALQHTATQCNKGRTGIRQSSHPIYKYGVGWLDGDNAVFSSVTSRRLVHMCDMTHPCHNLTWLNGYATVLSSVTWPIRMCDMTHRTLI